MSRREPRRQDADTQLDNQEEQQAHAQAGGAAVEQGIRDLERKREKFIDELQDVGFQGPDADALTEEFGPQLAGVYALANEDEDDYRRHIHLTDNKRDRRRASRNPGRLCTEPFRALAHGTHDRPDAGDLRPMTQRQWHLVNDAMDAKKAMHSLGKGGEGLSAVSEVTVETAHRRDTEPGGDDSGGLISKVFG